MKKGIVAILAIAIIGALGVYGKGTSSSAPAHILGAASGKSANPIPTVTDNISNNPSPSSNSNSNFKDGTFTGNSEDTPYGTVQIVVIVSGGKITDVNFLQLPSDLGHSQEVSAFSAPLLKQETLQKQSAQIDFVSGATSTSMGYEQSLQSALSQAA